jgi:hypothetical protein
MLPSCDAWSYAFVSFFFFFLHVLICPLSTYLQTLIAPSEKKESLPFSASCKPAELGNLAETMWSRKPKTFTILNII